jgi:hypothetical protein
MSENKVEVVAEDLKNFAKQQLMSYMGNQMGVGIFSCFMV